MPPFQSTTASGTLPIEQTKLMTATSGPTIGPQMPASTGSLARKKALQKLSGTQAPIAPAINKPPTMSFQTAAHSITKMCETAVKPGADRSRLHSDPCICTLISIAA